MTAAASVSAAAAQRIWQALLTAASAPYRSAGTFAWRFARGKLGMDPVFRYLLSHGLIAPDAHVLDIGCGQGLLTSLLREAGRMATQGRWPADWAASPVGARVTGIEMMPRDVARARAALAGLPTFICGDMRHTSFPAVDAVVILDVLHYIGVAEQDALLTRVRQALPTGGCLLLRIGDTAERKGFRNSQWVDHIVTFIRGHRIRPVFCRTLAQWTQQLESLGFEVQARPMSQGTPFANVLLIARVTTPDRKTERKS